MKEILFETKYWKVFLIDDQTYLGRSIITLKRDCGELSRLSSQEVLDFHINVIKKLEYVFKETFGATMFNWSCLMNNSYKAENPKPQIHYHFRPRYKNEVKFAGIIFRDEDFAHHYKRESKEIVTENILKLIAKEINKNF